MWKFLLSLCGLAAAVGPIVHPNANKPKVSCFGIDIDTVVAWAHIDNAAGGQDIDGLEIWSGVFAIGRSALKHDEICLSFDWEDWPGNDFVDLMTETGFRNLWSILRRLKRSALCWMSPQCSSFVFASSSRTNRFRSNVGNVRYVPVLVGNWFADIVGLVLVYCSYRQIAHVVVEQPVGSRFYHWQNVHQTLEYLKFMFGSHFGCFETALMCANSRKQVQRHELSFKRFTLWGPDLEWLASVTMKKCKCSTHSKLMFINDRGGICGNQQAMKDSQAYTDEFGEAIFIAHRFGELANLLSREHPVEP